MIFLCVFLSPASASWGGRPESLPPPAGRPTYKAPPSLLDGYVRDYVTYSAAQFPLETLAFFSAPPHHVKWHLFQRYIACWRLTEEQYYKYN
jgi:hypothetical protein